jgi:uncharacterized protein
MGDISNEPSMEEILSSIKRIIAEEGDAATVSRPRRTAARTAPVAPPPAPAFEDEDEVLELGEDMVPPPAERPRAPARPITPPPVESVVDENPSIEEASHRLDAILSERTAEASRQPLEALSRMIVKPEVTGSDTLEGMVRDMLRPMLREWLDANLPRVVEAMVAREISRITNRG